MPTVKNKIVSVTVGENGNSGLLAVGDGSGGQEMTLGVNATAVSGTSPTLDLTVEWLVDESIGADIGNATFDQTGGAVDDLWTLTTHGLQVNDQVQFTAVGTGAGGYAVDTTYHVTSVESANTFTLSATRGGAAIVGTADSVGTWTIAEMFTYAAPGAAPDDFRATSSDTTMAQITAASTRLESWRVRSDAYRIVWAVGGSATPTVTFEVREYVA